MAALAAGDRSRFDEVFRHVWPRVRALTGRLEGPDADDVAQQALCKVFERAGEYDASRPALPWILGIAAWEVRTVRKRAHRRREEPLPTTLVDASSAEDELIRADLMAAVRAEIGTLSAIDQHALNAALDAASGRDARSRKRLSRALARLRSAWRTRHGHG